MVEPRYADKATPVCYTIAEAAEALRLSRTTIYDMIKKGGLKTVRVGCFQRVPAGEIGRLLGVASTDTLSRDKERRDQTAKAKAAQVKALQDEIAAANAKIVGLRQAVVKVLGDLEAVDREMNALEQYFDTTGDNLHRLALRIGRSHSALSRPLAGTRDTSTTIALDVERGTDGQVTAIQFLKICVTARKSHLGL